MSRTMILSKLPTHGNVWTGTEMTHPSSLPEPVEMYPGWVWVNCGCCGGVEWGGEYPRECRECEGSARYAVHLATGTAALWPGGPFNGWRYDPDDARRYL